MESILRLFKAVPIVKKYENKTLDKKFLKITLNKGFILSPEITASTNYSEKEILELIKKIEKELCSNATAMNSTFHKSWEKVASDSTEQLVIEQIFHYITTYGYEALGIYDKESVYIPVEKLKIPKVDIDKIPLIIIKGYTKEELKHKVINLLSSGIALSNETKTDILDILTFVKIKDDEIHTIKNKEVKCVLYTLLNKFPENPVEFLRYLIYIAIGKTLIIKDKRTIEEIKITVKKGDVLGLLINYESKYGLENLAEIFYRFKPLFLSFKGQDESNRIINKIRRLAITHHKPMKDDYLNTITAKIKNGINITEEKLKDALSKVNTFRKIRLAYALKFRTNTDIDSILYKIRNGKSYATTFEFNEQEKAKKILDIVIDSIIDGIKPNLKGKKIYLPNNIIYALPATEKQFTGNLPTGSCIIIPKDMIIGVNWENVDGNRVDLDLSLVGCDSGKIGWDARYKTNDRDILFSGDLTDAPKPDGATELFYIKKQDTAAFILMLNYYNYNESVEVPFKIIAASESAVNFKHNYVVNPNNIVAIAKSKIDKKQKMLGLLITTSAECKFYFTETNIGNVNTSYNEAEYIEQTKRYLLNYYSNMISFNDIIKKSGAKIVEDPKKCDINLSIESLEKDTILNLLTKKGE